MNAEPLTMPDGIYYDIPEWQYHADKTRISKHDLDVISISPAHFAHKCSTPTEYVSPALKFGQALHCAVLQPSIYSGAYVVRPDFGDQRKTANKEAKATWETEHAKQKWITEEDADRIRAMVAAIEAHAGASGIMEAERTEVTVYATNNGVKVRSRFDALDGFIGDLKSCASAAPEDFAKDCANYRYHVQAAFYLDNALSLGHEIERFRIVAVEKDPPYAVAVYDLDDRSIDRGRELYQRDLERYKQCLEWDHWPGYSQKPQLLTLPRWAFSN